VFENIDKEYRDMMIEVIPNPSVVEACTIERYTTLKGWSDSIKKCERALNDYLE